MMLSVASSTVGSLLFGSNSNVYIRNCTVSGNKVSSIDRFGAGGGISCYSENVSIDNSILWGNEGPEGPQIYVGGDSNTSVSYTDVQGGQANVYVEPSGVLEWGLGNIDMEPGFVESGYWDANSTPKDANDDFWVDGDYHLLEGSACINAGDPNYEGEPGETDLDGMPRVVDGRIDMGAYEAGLPAVEVEVTVTPEMLNCASKGNWVKAHVILPEGYWPEDIDVNTPAVAEPMGAESEYMKVFDDGEGEFGVEIGFDREAFCAAGAESEDGYLDVIVRGWLLTGQPFEGTDTIKVISQRLRRRERITTIRRGVRKIR
jgi:hypothetical protein